MLVFTHPACLAHDPGPDHPERPERLQAVLQALHHSGLELAWREAPPARRGDLRRVHEAALIDQVLAAVEAGTVVSLDDDTRLSPGSAQAALHAAGAGVAAVDALMAGEDAVAFCAVRPPGHHASADTAMGFCLLNNIAVAAAHARDQHGLERIAIVDFDVHHGNGTQAIFRDEPKVAYLSSHQSDLYPLTGRGHERGAGNLYNVLLPPGAGSFQFRNAWADELLPALDAFAPQLLLVSAGFDAHHLDPLGGLRVTTDGFRQVMTLIDEASRRLCGRRAVWVVEGGYHLGALAECLEAAVDVLS